MAGITTVVDDVGLSSASLIVDNDVSLGCGILTIRSNGAVTPNAGDDITAARLRARGRHGGTVLGGSAAPYPGLIVGNSPPGLVLFNDFVVGGTLTPHEFYYSALGAAAPPWPMNNDVPSGSVMSRPLARNVRSFAWKPSTWTFVPAGTELRFQPWRISAFGAPPSTAHCCFSPVSVVTSMCSHE